MLKEFKEFALRGNVLDLAVGVIIGGTFGRIVTSLVNDIIMPPIGLVIGGVDFTDFFIDLSGRHAATLAQAKATGSATMNIGVFLNATLDFVIVAFAVFLLIQNVNRLVRKPPSEKTAPVARECPYCLSMISARATRCASCTSTLEAVA
ncbi:MAG: large conductance mechanosensitive channel protein MscL [Acidobacteria bacterium]|nr:large conductance mechanosensitive channel protein MscL [Acidobacteriota bacterium]